MGKWIHRLTNIDTVNRLGTCSNCGLVKLKRKGSSWRCYYSSTYGSLNSAIEKKKVCEICGDSNKELMFDHDHKTGLHRGWLCVRCNTLLGYAEDSVLILKKAIGYLKR